METALQGTEGSPNPRRREQVDALLSERPELAHRPTELAKILGVSIGRGKGLLFEWRASRKAGLLGPVLLQNLHLVTRTTPGRPWSGSPPPGWVDRGDHKRTIAVDLPPDGRMDVSEAPNGTAEVTIAAPRGLTPAEVLHALAFAKALLPLDPDHEGTFTFEALRDGSSLRLDGLEAVTLRSAESVLTKLYNHSDRRGEALRMEVRTPAATVSLREAEAWLMDRQPLGRDAKIEALALQTGENTKAILMLRRELRRRRFDHGSPRGSPASPGGDEDAVR
jgi:hypothetical protein